MFRSIASLKQISRRTVVVAASALVICTVIAFASVPDANGVIHGCYHKSSGVLRVIDNSSAQCNNNETPIQWNQAGPQGAPGPQGPEGPQGPAGPGGAKAMVYLNLDGSIGRCY